jgi:hypothetical protein
VYQTDIFQLLSTMHPDSRRVQKLLHCKATHILYVQYLRRLIKSAGFQMEDTIEREGKVYSMLWHSECRIEMTYPLLSSEGAIDLWMQEIEGCTSEMVDKAIKFLDSTYLCELPCPTHIWNFEP